MTFCGQCGARRRARDRFCSECGHPFRAQPEDLTVEDLTTPTSPARGADTTELAAPAPPTAPRPEPPGEPEPGLVPVSSSGWLRTVPVPGWLTRDWHLVGLAAAVAVGVLVLSSLLYGLVLGLVATGRASGASSGAAGGLWLGFVALGAPTRVGLAGPGGTTLGFAARYLPLGLVLLPGVATWIGLRAVWSRLGPERADRAAFVAKLAVAFGLLIGVLARLASFGRPAPGAPGGRGASVAAGPAALYAGLVVAATGALFLGRLGRGRTTRPVSWARGVALPAALAGARAWALLAAITGLLALGAGTGAADSGTERILFLLATPLLGVNLAAQAATVALGGSVGLAPAMPQTRFPFSLGPGFTDHLSLFHIGFPPGPDAGAAPLPAFLVLALAPALVAWSVLLYLRSGPGPSRTNVPAVVAGAALGFAAAAWLGAVASGISVAAVADHLPRPRGLLVSRAGAGGAFGLGLLWGALGAAAAALAWIRGSGRRPGPPAPAAAEVRSDQTPEADL